LLYTKEQGAKKYPPEVVEAFFECVEVLKSAKDERDLYALKGLHYEKLKGKRQPQRSLRLNDQWRLIIEVVEDDYGNLILIIKIEDYH
jgi:proteic killer suppression protein